MALYLLYGSFLSALYVANTINLRCCCLNRQPGQEAPRHAALTPASSFHISPPSTSCLMSLMSICTPTPTGGIIGRFMVYF